MSTDAKNYKKREIIKKIADNTFIREDIVRDVYDGLIDVVIEEIVNNGEFHIKELLTVSTSEWKSYKINGNQVNKQERLTIRLSDTVKKLWKIRREEFDNSKNVIKAKNWREILRKFNRKKKKVVKEFENPFLDY